jgi:hypothetical protein
MRICSILRTTLATAVTSFGKVGSTQSIRAAPWSILLAQNEQLPKGREGVAPDSIDFDLSLWWITKICEKSGKSLSPLSDRGAGRKIEKRRRRGR